MSRRRESFTPAPSPTDEELLAAFFGEQQRHLPMTVPGCSAPCCRTAVSLAVAEAEARLEGAVRLVTWTSIVAAVLVVACVAVWWRWM